MIRFCVFLIFATVLVDGRPRHHKHKKAHQAIHLSDEVSQQAYHKPMDDSATGPPQNVNVYNLGVHKMGKDNKVTGQLDAHNVAVAMQGPGMISLAATQQQMAPGDQKPDHTISVIKDTPSGQSYHVMNVHSGHKLPVVLPLTELPSPQETPKESKSNEQQSPAQTQELPRVHTKPKPKTALQEGQILSAGHKRKDERQKNGVLVHLQQKVNKEKASKELTNLESSVPVVNHQPKHEERVDNGHKIKVANAGEPQKVFGRVDPSNVALTVQGPGSASVTSNVKGGSSQTVIFDPKPYDPCPGNKCPNENGGNGTRN